MTALGRFAVLAVVFDDAQDRIEARPDVGFAVGAAPDADAR